MGEIVIRVENLGKRYRVGQRHSYATLRDVVAGRLSAPFAFLSSLTSRSPSQQNERLTSRQTIWALRNVTFEVKRGEILGIIGPNGAGKSTVLKILSRVTKPTEGYVEIHGRVGSLLEVGTGFHPELTGRENIFLNGAILGMKNREIRRKFDEIVTFAEVEEFIDTPVKRYSSGMYMRLAFSVAAHLEPEILIVDEVLAVGDAAFQKKSLGKMDRVAKEGRTVIFVSHNMGLIQTLCTRGIVLSGGKILADDTATGAVATYLKTLEERGSQRLLDRAERGGKGDVRICQVEIASADGSASAALATGRPARFAFWVTSTRPSMSCSFTIYDQLGQPVTYFDSAPVANEYPPGPESGTKFVCELDQLLLIPGRYRINAAIVADGELHDHLEGAAFFDVEPGKLGIIPVLGEAGYGSALMPHRWSRSD